jgi:hypothetical protein
MQNYDDDDDEDLEILKDDNWSNLLWLFLAVIIVLWFVYIYYKFFYHREFNKESMLGKIDSKKGGYNNLITRKNKEKYSESMNLLKDVSDQGYSLLPEKELFKYDI